MFGDELDRFAYANADRIAVVGLTASKTRMSSVTSNDLFWTKFPPGWRDLRSRVFTGSLRNTMRRPAHSPAFPSEAWREELDEYAQVTRAEGEYIEAVREEISLLVADIPSGVARFHRLV